MNPKVCVRWEKIAFIWFTLYEMSAVGKSVEFESRLKERSERKWYLLVDIQ